MQHSIKIEVHKNQAHISLSGTDIDFTRNFANCEMFRDEVSQITFGKNMMLRGKITKAHKEVLTIDCGNNLALAHSVIKTLNPSGKSAR